MWCRKQYIETQAKKTRKVQNVKVAFRQLKKTGMYTMWRSKETENVQNVIQ